MTGKPGTMGDLRTIFAMAVLTLAGGPPAAAQTIVPTYNAMDAETLKGIIAAQGSSQVTVEAADPQSSVVKVQMASGIIYSVYMDDCEGGQPNLCKSLEFRASLPAGSINFSQVNGFNETMRYATAYLTDKGVPQLRMDENLRGGVTADFVGYANRIFVKIVQGYVQQAK
jgi:hypothetical protein